MNQLHKPHRDIKGVNVAASRQPGAEEREGWLGVIGVWVGECVCARVCVYVAVFSPQSTTYRCVRVCLCSLFLALFVGSVGNFMILLSSPRSGLKFRCLWIIYLSPEMVDEVYPHPHCIYFHSSLVFFFSSCFVLPQDACLCLCWPDSFQSLFTLNPLLNLLSLLFHPLTSCFPRNCNVLLYNQTVSHPQTHTHAARIYGCFYTCAWEVFEGWLYHKVI